MVKNTLLWHGSFVVILKLSLSMTGNSLGLLVVWRHILLNPPPPLFLMIGKAPENRSFAALTILAIFAICDATCF